MQAWLFSVTVQPPPNGHVFSLLAGMTVSVSAAVIAACMGLIPMLVIVVVTMHIRIERKRACNKRVYRFIRITADTAVKLNSRLCESHLRTAADTAANKSVRFECREHAGKRAVTGAVCINYFCFYNVTVLHIVHLKLLRVSEMLKNSSVFIRHCNSHNFFSFSHEKLFLNLLLKAILFVAKIGTAIAQAVIPSFDFQRQPKRQCLCKLLSRPVIDVLRGRSSHAKLRAARLL